MTRAPQRRHAARSVASAWSSFRRDFAKGSLRAEARRHGALTATQVAWQLKKGAPNKPSLLLVDDLLYMINDGGIASCLEAKTGTVVWAERVGGNYSARRRSSRMAASTSPTRRAK